MSSVLKRRRVKDEAEMKILEILEERCEGAIGEPFGLSASQVAEHFNGVSVELISNALRGMEEVSSYQVGDSRKYVLKEYVGCDKNGR